MKAVRSRLTFANVISCLALFVALGGAAYAATKLPKNSVGTKQIKNSAVTAAKVKKGAITGAQIKSGSLTGTQVNAATLGTVPTAQNANIAQTANTLAAPEAWHEVGTPDQPAFLNSWANQTALHSEPVGFYRDKEGIVHLKGAATGGTSDTAIFDLPPGFRPASTHFIREPVACEGGTGCPDSVSSIAVVGTNFVTPALEGAVVAAPNTTSVYLDGVTFRAGS